MVRSLFDQIQGEMKKLDISVRSLRKTGTEFAQAEMDYKIILREEALKLRDGGEAVGMIDKTVYGVRRVAEVRFKRDVAEAVYKANLEAINATKLYIKVLMNQYDKEYGTHE
jgi:ribosomal protein L31E